MGLRRGHQARPVEWLAEKGILLVSLSAILMVFLIFLFVARESLPIMFGLMDSSIHQEVIPVEEMASLSEEELAAYLDLSKAELREMDEDTLRLLMEVKAEEIAEAREVDLSTLIDGSSENPNKPGTDAADANRCLDDTGEWLVMMGVCTHLGCVPLGDGAGEYNGWFCPCHGSHYDTAGRIRKGPAPENLHIPVAAFVDANTIKLG